MDSVLEQLQVSRQELLDMGIRGNSLLHFRYGARNIEVIDEISSVIYKKLVDEKKSLSFLPIPESESENEEDALPLIELIESSQGEGRHNDNFLQTKLNNDALDKKLIRINAEAESYLQEQGVDILYLALGFLNWYEDNNSDQLRHAPLVLVPVTLSRSGVKDRFKLTYSDADMGANLTLQAKLKMEFKLELSDYSDEFDFTKYCQQASDLVEKMPRWEVNENEIALGFFSFGKFQMYQDLDPANWPNDKSPDQHELLKKLFGGGFVSELENLSSLIESDKNLLELNLDELHLVKDADSSQTSAVLAAKQGANLVIQGPPGTGKSQTITNIISESLSDGKSVLFVSEKMAALEVVKRRLDETHLGDAVLELHSHKSNKRVVLEELKRTLELGKPKTQSRTADKDRHRLLREQLDDYCKAVNSSVLNSNVTYIAALGEYLKINSEVISESLPELSFEKMRSWDDRTFQSSLNLIRELVQHLDQMGTPSDSPFSESKLSTFSPVDQNQLTNNVNQALILTDKIVLNGESLAEKISLSVPQSLSDMAVIVKAAKRSIDAPHLSGVLLTTDDWQQRRDQIRTLIKTGSEMSELKFKHSNDLIDQAWAADLLESRNNWLALGNKWWKVFSGRYRHTKNFLQSLSKKPLSKDYQEVLELIDDILKYQSLKGTFDSYRALGETIFRAQWQAEQSEWDVLHKISNWVIKLYEDFGRASIPDGLLNFLEGGKNLKPLESELDELDKLVQSLESTLASITHRLAISDGVAQQDIYFNQLRAKLHHWNDRIDSLYAYTRYNHIREKLNQAELKEIDQLAFGWTKSPYLLEKIFIKTWYQGLVNEAYKTNEAIKIFDRISHESAIQEFRNLDEQLFFHAQESLVMKHFEQMPSSHANGEVAIIRKEINKKRRHLPIRKLISLAGNAIQRIKPVFMMSPMSVATYLPQGAIDFDLVVFDEASQVKVVDALGPILRGKQVVVVGDTKQMPPSAFFGKAFELSDEEAEMSETADIESILGMFLSQGAPETMLRWHYRSRHDSLITVSNHEFYENKLMVFPSPGVNSSATGLKFNYLQDAPYDRGGSRTNQLEARAVAEAVIEHAKYRPMLTLGVVAFSTAQRDCILLEIERLRRLHPETDSFFIQPNLESFFVKNLENVQGDERDVIYISIGYGKTATGKVSRSFGPVNTEGGHRRLNVLITRSRLSMEVFCNFRADELETSSTSPFGVKALKNFLHYAETKELISRIETGKDTDSPFEDEVISAIHSLGYDIEAQVGSEGFFIDIAVRDPNKPGRYILAVECDGASYHSSATARDRDRLRQSVLEGLGWRFHRIWSTDWFRNSQKETDRLRESIRASISYYENLDNEKDAYHQPNPQPQPLAEDERAVIDRDEIHVQDKVSAPKYKTTFLSPSLFSAKPLHEISVGIITGALSKIVEDESPIHIKEAARRIAEASGVAKVGARILKHITTATEYAHSKQYLYYEKEFLYKSEGREALIRDRSDLPASQKKIEFIAPEEIKAAIYKTVHDAVSIDSDEALTEALSILGFQRVTAKMKESVLPMLNDMVWHKQLMRNGERLFLPA